jgi:hypothetical protein
MSRVRCARRAFVAPLLRFVRRCLRILVLALAAAGPAPPPPPPPPRPQTAELREERSEGHSEH